MEFTDQVSVMENEVQTLRTLLGQVAASQPLVDLSGGSASAAARGFMAQMQQEISTLDANRVLVFAGQKTFDSWWSLAQDYENALRSQVGEAANYTLTNGITGAAAATMGEVGQGVTDIGNAVKSGTTWGVIAFVALALVAWRLS